jgi:arylsulfatase A-like enzyme
MDADHTPGLMEPRHVPLHVMIGRLVLVAVHHGDAHRRIRKMVVINATQPATSRKDALYLFPQFFMRVHIESSGIDCMRNGKCDTRWPNRFAFPSDSNMESQGMKKHSVLISIGLATAALAQDKPNIILIMADDMGWSDIGCYGAMHIKTPNIDRIAAEGMLFTRFYNNAKCTTTRASLLTGLYPRQGGRGIELIGKDMITLGEGMRLAGYATGMSGKWHNGSSRGTRPWDRGFDEAYGLWDGGSNYFNPVQRDPDFKGGRVRVFGHNDELITEFSDDYYTTDAFGDHAVETIRKQVKAGKPFFHYLPFNAPHYPLQAKPEDIAAYKGKFSAGWDKLIEERRANQIRMGLIDPKTWPDIRGVDKVRGWDDAKGVGEEWQNLRMETYAAMVTSMDRNIGKVLDTLDELGIAENTLILFLSDNGACSETPGGTTPKQVPGPKEFYSHVGPGWAHFQNTPLRRYKATCHEGGVATPLVARWPKRIKPGAKTDAVGHIIDFMPTFLEVAVASYPQEYDGEKLLPLEGKSLLPVFSAKTGIRGAEDMLFWNWSGTRAVRKGDWKIVWDGRSKAWELYDLSADRTETRNLAPENPTLVKEMGDKWNEWAIATGVKK